MCDAIERAATDAGLAGVPAADIRVVSLLSWRYRDPAHFIAERLVSRTARDGHCRPRRQQPPDARERHGRRDPTRASSTSPSSPAARRGGHGCGPARPTPTLPVAEVPEGTAPRSDHRPRPGDEPRRARWPGASWCRCRCTRCSRPRSERRPARGWRSTRSGSASCGPGSPRSPPPTRTRGCRSPRRRPRSARPGPANRMIGLPYPKYMNSNNDVDQAAALHHLLGRAGAGARCARGSMGVRPRRLRLPRAHLHLRAVDVLPRHRRSSSAGGRRWHSPGCPSTTSTSSTSTRASPRPCSWAPLPRADRSTVNSPAPAG